MQNIQATLWKWLQNYIGVVNFALRKKSCQFVAKLPDNANNDPEIPVFLYTLYSAKLKIKTYHQHNLFASTLYMQYLQKDHQNIENCCHGDILNVAW